MSETSHNWPFDTVLVANRGEIAARVLRTVQKLGLKGAIVYHAADRLTVGVALADIAIEITGETPVAAYLDGAQIIAAAKQCGAGAIHPGYGFLSENHGFAAAVEAAGLRFVGPTPEQIDAMGDKVRARNAVEKAGFPVAPSAIEDDDPATFVERARKVGAPLLIKPSAGGGGKGMHIVRDLTKLETEIEHARSEAKRYFGDGRLFAERYVDHPHHIEVQVLGDGQGNVIHVMERECSVQRRFQKIIEETPSPSLTPEKRREICETAAGIARSINYRNAGTVEFIFGAKGEFYFLEMNTRLQVEHPITEEINRVDLVEHQLRVAAGEKLALTQADIQPHGHAIECRIYAEDAAHNYTPTTGPLLVLRPPSGQHVRWDSGVVEGGAVTAAFDPMIAKLIVWAEQRDEAIARMDAALHNTVLLGCKTNIGFLRRLITSQVFHDAQIHTSWLDGHPEATAEPGLSATTLHALLAAAALSTKPLRDAANAVPDLHAAIGAWRS
ncbi:MAG TPA: biotin carboxylase N-terminal domain-containing protein [Nevskiaceae bacterium]|nr:biotin carboxylase N-terminal domain-containing protein [Nevskiaceae bacterium]